MPAGTLISVEEYLRTAYRPDCDYVDGHIEERNLGEQDHSNLQMALSAYLYARRKQWGIKVLPEQRVQVRANRFRVPDVCVVLGDTAEQILTRPPFICIEVLSREDRLSRVLERAKDFISMGVRYIWVLDPETHTAYSFTAADGLREIKSGMLKTENPAIEVPLDELFES
jgi:Uma2 family endonuclease